MNEYSKENMEDKSQNKDVIYRCSMSKKREAYNKAGSNRKKESNWRRVAEEAYVMECATNEVDKANFLDKEKERKKLVAKKKRK